MGKKTNAINRFLSDRVDIIIMPRAGASKKIKLTGLTFVIFIALWLAVTLGSLWLWSKAYDYHLTKADNKLMRVKMQLISDELERGRKYLSLTQNTEQQMRQMLGMPGGKFINLPKGLEAKKQKEEDRAQQLFGSDLKEFDTEEFEKYIDSMQETAEERLASFQEIAWYFANRKDSLNSTPSIRPSSSRISSGYGYRRDPFGRPTGRMHKGLDFAGKPDSPIVSTADGVVRHTGWVSGYGQAVLIDHGFGYSTLYAHATGIKVKAGEVVKRGQIIAFMGTTGRSTGTHLHYEVWKDGQAVNPRNYFK
ncbi:MAG: M23 family metallopeptidase [Elusimicrobiaceae bacterium]|nr:M23 family metallopeptidase [Elusimicrobiaceae bacterium]